MKTNFFSYNFSSLSLRVKLLKCISEFSLEDNSIQHSWAVWKSLSKIKILSIFHGDLLDNKRCLHFLTNRFQKLLTNIHPRDEQNTIIQRKFHSLKEARVNLNNLLDWKGLFKQKSLNSLILINETIQFEQHALPVSEHRYASLCHRLPHWLSRFNNIKIYVNGGFDHRLSALFRSLGNRLPNIQKSLKGLDLFLCHQRDFNPLDFKVCSILTKARALSLLLSKESKFLHFLARDSLRFVNLKALDLVLPGNLTHEEWETLHSFKQFSKLLSISISLVDVLPLTLHDFFSFLSIPINVTLVKLYFSFKAGSKGSYSSVIFGNAFKTFCGKWQQISIQTLHFSVLGQNSELKFSVNVLLSLLSKMSHLEQLDASLKLRDKEQPDDKTYILQFHQLIDALRDSRKNLKGLILRLPSLIIDEIVGDIGDAASLRYLRISSSDIKIDNLKNFLDFLENCVRGKQLGLLQEGLRSTLELDMSEVKLCGPEELKLFLEQFKPSPFVRGEIQIKIEDILELETLKLLSSFLSSFKGKSYLILKINLSAFRKMELKSLKTLFDNEQKNLRLEIEAYNAQKVCYSPTRRLRICSKESDDDEEEDCNSIPFWSEDESYDES